MNSYGVLFLAAALIALPTRLHANRRFMALLQHFSDPQVRRTRTPGAADPLAAATTFDLMAACLRAGLPLAVTASAVAPHAPTSLADSLRRAADLLILGADPATAWATTRHTHSHTTSDPVDALARMARRSARSGTPMATAIAELAQQHRETAADTAAARAQRAGVLVAGPLGLCFLPAFLCLGIVPTVIGLAGHVLNGGLL